MTCKIEVYKTRAYEKFPQKIAETHTYSSVYSYSHYFKLLFASQSNNEMKSNKRKYKK